MRHSKHATAEASASTSIEHKTWSSQYRQRLTQERKGRAEAESPKPVLKARNFNCAPAQSPGLGMTQVPRKSRNKNRVLAGNSIFGVKKAAPGFKSESAKCGTLTCYPPRPQIWFFWQLHAKKYFCVCKQRQHSLVQPASQLGVLVLRPMGLACRQAKGKAMIYKCNPSHYLTHMLWR